MYCSWIVASRDVVGSSGIRMLGDLEIAIAPTTRCRNTSNSFHILVADVLLRQTQAERVVGPYLEFIKLYPDADAMAHADVNHLRRWFKPLGLVQRADRLVGVVKIPIAEYDGQVPREVDTLMKLPGLGRSRMVD